ncbi:hypothetical protein MMC07_000648 [Pseudocyphellaria aurata]|nr:hypothetical protein [Pseudocyphellaria aurata]
MGAADVEINPFNLTEVFAPEHRGSAKVDIVFVHGLNGHPEHTWTSEKSKVFWPTQLLPPVLDEEEARILVYGYDANVTSFTDGGVGRDKIHNHAEHLVAVLAANRKIRKAIDRPIIFVAHSLGGLVVKRALIHSSEIRGSKTDHLRSIFVSTYGILFLGTPHRGADVAKWGSRLERICGAVIPGRILDTRRDLIDDLKSNNETLTNIDRQFIQIIGRFHVFFFHEGKPTKVGGSLVFIVDEDSASPTVQDVERAVIQADHSHMCKFENDNAPGFDLVVEAIQRYAEQAPDVIPGRWKAEKQEHGLRIAAEKTEMSMLFPDTDSVRGTSQTSSQDPSPSNSTSHLSSPASSVPLKTNVKDDATNTTEVSAQPPEPYFIVPPGFRANTFFVGMDKEMQELNRHLFDSRRRDGTACVLLHGQAGGGKSHLARQYVYKNKKKFSGGIFWIFANLKEERYHAFWDIHQKVVSRESPELCARKDENFVERVKSWFEARHEWLIVFDGVVIDKDLDATELQSFVPDSKNSSIIYISRAGNLESKQRLLRPFPIKVAPLKDDLARKLLFKELHIKKPTDAEVKRATELVKKIGGLPLAIVAISHRLADTHEPLTKFNIKSYSADPKLGGTYHKILDDLLRLGHVEAWNLIHILCFYGQHIPVEMVHLGLRALRTYSLEVKSREDSGKADINTTFSILMRYALIERNEPDDKDSKSSSRDSLFEPEPIDMLKVHNVVQKFCCDSLNANDRLPTWLAYAVRLFCYSFKDADIKIKNRLERGRVSDYRYYLVHGQRLWDHSEEYESKAQPLGHIRTELKPVLELINEEIESREPGSSQESVNRRIFQTSIFDRNNSSSESGPSIDEARTPEHRPAPLPLPVGAFDDIFGKTTHSPRSFGTASPPEPRIVDNSPSLRSPPLFPEDGYESDHERVYGSQSMHKNPSDVTARPTAPSTGAHGDEKQEWQVVPPSRKRLRRRDLGSFRPTPPRPSPPRTQAQLDMTSAVGSISRQRQKADGPSRPSTDAFASLRKVNHRSPPRSNNNQVTSWHRRLSGLPPKQPLTYAGVVKGQSQQSSSRSNLPPSTRQGGPPPRSALMENIRSSDNPDSRQEISRPSSRTSEYVPQTGAPGYALVEAHTDGQTNISPRHQYSLQSSASSLPESARPRYVNETPDSNYSPPWIQGPNPAPMHLDRDISITTTRPYPFEFHVPYPSSPYPTNSARLHSQSPRSQPRTHHSSPPLPTGYYSQPMSRHESRQSRNSTAETEPVHQHHHRDSFSPYAPAAPFLFPRDRNGQPLRKSPKMADYDFPGAHELSGAGDWAYPISGGEGSTDGAIMSRSSSGPGLAVTGEGGGLGIVEFVQFGEHEPVSVDEARRRTMHHEQRLLTHTHMHHNNVRDVSRGRGRRREPRFNAHAVHDGQQDPRSRSRPPRFDPPHDRQDPHSSSRSRPPPYPDLNRIPTFTGSG